MAWQQLLLNTVGEQDHRSPPRDDRPLLHLDVWISMVAIYGIVFGTGAIWWLLTRKDRQQKDRQQKPTYLWTKLAVISALITTTVLQAALWKVNGPLEWLGDRRFWTNLLVILSLIVILVVQSLEHSRLLHANSIVLFYWLFFLIVFGVKVFLSAFYHVSDRQPVDFILSCVELGLATLQFALVWGWLAPKAGDYAVLQDREGNPSEQATMFSLLSFSWMTPMLKHGYKQQLTEDDLWDLAEADSTRVTAEIFNDAWTLELQRRRRPSLWVALLRGFIGLYIQGISFKTASDILLFVQPQLLRLLLSFVDTYQSGPLHHEPLFRGMAIALAMFGVSLMQTLCLHQCFHRIFQAGSRMKASLISAVYTKSLRLSNESRSMKSTGEIVNLMAVDCQRLQNLTNFGQHLLSAPLQVILCMVSLYQLLGYSMFAGVVIMVAVIPVNGYITKILKGFQRQQIENKDWRIRLITEVISNIKCVKLLGWNTAFMEKLGNIRKQELKTLRKIGALQAFSMFTWSIIPFLTSSLTLAVFVLTQSEPLTADIVFPALTLFNILASPLTVIPGLLSAITEASVAVDRLTAFLTAEDLQSDSITRLEPVIVMGEQSVRVHNATFKWGGRAARHILEDVDLSVCKGELCCIVGRVGAGKSSLIQALLGDLFKVHGEVTIHGSIAYVAQQPWVLNASVRENITFGHRWDPVFYDQTVKACALLDDFDQLPDGDRTEVGEKGISLSGGQKARLALARAVYARADVYLLDDCLSAVDQHVGRHLIDNVLGPRGILKSKARILATNSIPILFEAQSIVMMHNQTILERGTFDQLRAMNGEFTSFVGDVTRSQDDHQSRDKVTLGASPMELREGAIAESASSRKSSISTIGHASIATFRGSRDRREDVEAHGGHSKSTKELMEKGKVKWKVYAEYARSSSLLGLAFYSLALISSQSVGIGGGFWLKQWSEVNQEVGSNLQIGKYIGVYVALGVASASLAFVHTLILLLFCSVEASRKLHEKMALSTIRSPMAFFETTPAGQILNRFSSDMYRVDEGLARQLNGFFTHGVAALFTLFIISAGTPLFMLLIIPLIWLYFYMQGYYLRTKRVLKRLDSVSRSPIYAHFQESLGGVATIRAFGLQGHFALRHESHVDANLRAYIPSIYANRWLGVRLESIGSTVILFAASFAVHSVSSGSHLSAGMVGLTMSYALQITQSLNSLVRLSGEAETSILSVERVLEYTKLPSEAPDIVHTHRPPISWPAHGAVKYLDYSARYRPGLDLVLKHIDLDIQPGEKIGVVGRTGAGKSSLALSLFRIIEPSEGRIIIDNLDTSSIGLLDLRERLTIIPQDAALFEGTIRSNLDPRDIHDDTELWGALADARLKEHVSRMPGGLDAKVCEGGSNLSQGQRQLVSLTRALLRPSNILVLDEATAAVDIETDKLLHEALLSNFFENRTVITITHRISSIIHSDRIVVLAKGEVAECDTPAALMARKGFFYELVKEAGLQINEA